MVTTAERQRRFWFTYDIEQRKKQEKEIFFNEEQKNIARCNIQLEGIEN